jgi:hypothetical protein
MPTTAVTVERSASTFMERATSFSALWKQAAYPHANSCSGLVVPGVSGPPSPLGRVSWRSRLPSDEVTRPSRPPSAVAMAV